MMYFKLLFCLVNAEYGVTYHYTEQIYGKICDYANKF